MSELHVRDEGNDPSSAKVNLDYVESWVNSRPRSKEPLFYSLVKELDDTVLSEIIWIFYGNQSIEFIDEPIPYLNPNLSWYKFWKKKNTVRSLVKTTEGKWRVWRMLHDAGAWM